LCCEGTWAPIPKGLQVKIHYQPGRIIETCVQGLLQNDNPKIETCFSYVWSLRFWPVRWQLVVVVALCLPVQRIGWRVQGRSTKRQATCHIENCMRRGNAMSIYVEIISFI
jgi:hypothetical protein